MAENCRTFFVERIATIPLSVATRTRSNLVGRPMEKKKRRQTCRNGPRSSAVGLPPQNQARDCHELLQVGGVMVSRGVHRIGWPSITAGPPEPQEGTGGDPIALSKGGGERDVEGPQDQHETNIFCPFDRGLSPPRFFCPFDRAFFSFRCPSPQTSLQTRMRPQKEGAILLLYQGTNIPGGLKPCFCQDSPPFPSIDK